MEIVHSFASTVGEINILMIVYECVCRSSLHIMIHWPWSLDNQRRIRKKSLNRNNGYKKYVHIS